ncbi:MAG: tRNA (adenosine(37)-N6)-threonylcarbamoyltransferase complex dimerization subunit type 1 TsaB [Gammaproteobacteria bacterium]|nr:tRNA (adenosine(37)-N6)-threonylcarbamoyltransferase complex dimerization subunit type 1 TsaB [Gammaproteobacteria bacterium]
MNILAIDTATEACSAALYLGDASTGNKVTSTYQLAPRQHSRLILKMIDDLLKAKGLAVIDLDAIAFGRGPGSFMGLRIAAGVVQGIAFSHDIPVIPLSTLKVIAVRAYQETQNENILVAIDARMDEVYWAAYTLQVNQWLLVGEEQVISPDKIQLPDVLVNKEKAWIGAGTGWGAYADRLLSNADIVVQNMLPDCLPAADIMVQMAVQEFADGNTVTAAEAIPIYLRNDVAKKPKPVVF